MDSSVNTLHFCLQNHTLYVVQVTSSTNGKREEHPIPHNKLLSHILMCIFTSQNAQIKNFWNTLVKKTHSISSCELLLLLLQELMRHFESFIVHKKILFLLSCSQDVLCIHYIRRNFTTDHWENYIFSTIIAHIIANHLFVFLFVSPYRENHLQIS